MTGARCPCCGFRTLGECGAFEICPVCYWEDDGQDESDLEIVRGGPNGELSLRQARLNFTTFGACAKKLVLHVRRPLNDER